jgi:hypothetical protein
MLMTLSVSPNGDGTITITCGNDSVTIGAPASSKPQASTDIPVLWPNGGATASIVAGGKAKLNVIRVPSGDDLLKVIREQHDLHVQASEPTIFQFLVQTSEPLNVEEINRTFSDLGNPDWMGTQIKLTGPSDE